MKKALVIGGGFAGCASVHQLLLMDTWDVTLVEAAPFLGAGVRTFWYGGHPYTFGPRHFLTQNREVYDYLDKYCPLRRCLDQGSQWVVVDLSQAAFLDSSGLGALTNSKRRIERKGGRLVVINTNDQMRRVFELTGLMRVLNVVPDRAHALAFVDECRNGSEP